jgi:DNA-binding transcriptional MerR regulator
LKPGQIRPISTGNHNDRAQPGFNRAIATLKGAPMFSIGQLSRHTGVKIPTIRYYEQMGLMDVPERSAGNQRRYSRDDLKRLSFIRHSRELGITIGDIGELLELSRHPDAPCADAHDIASRHLVHIRSKLARLKRLETDLERLSACDAKTLTDCSVIETLADHALCETEH